MPKTVRKDPIARITALMRTGRHEDAAQAAKELISVDPTNLAAFEMLAKCLWQAGKMEEVVDATRRLIVLNPYEPGYHALQGSALQVLGRYGEAVRAYSRAGNEPGVREALADLLDWQGCLVAELLASDTVFRAHYAQSPAEACATRGFVFLEPEARSDNWILSGERRDSLYIRPS
jgi:tetratricopeptide (TPR) repeat protein